MKTVKVYFENGDSLTTDINGTDEEIKNYYKVGSKFNLGNAPVNGDGSYGDNMQAVVKVEI